MKARLATTALVIAAVTVGLVWASLQPALAHLGEVVRQAGGPVAALAVAQRMSGVALALDLVLVTFVALLLLQLLFGRHLGRLAEAVQSLAPGAGEGRGPPLLRLERALRRLAASLGEERQRDRAQVQALQSSNERLARLQAELVAADRLATVGKLASGVAHEVGNPLAGILGYLSVIRMQARGQGPVLEVADRIEAEVQRIDQIVRSLLELGRPSRGKAQPIDVRPVVDSCVQLLSAGRDLANVRVSVEAPPSAWLRAEAGPLSQVLVNLLLNAAQAMGGQGAVRVRVTVGEHQGQIAVEDDGPGLSEAVRQRLFEPFFTTRAPGQGTGLGLAVSRHLLAQFDGTLEAANHAGGGARFVITLPVP